MLTCFLLFLGHSLSKCNYNNRYYKSWIYSDIRLLQCIIKLHNAQLISFHRTALLYCVSSCNLKGDGLVANVKILEGHFFQNIKQYHWNWKKFILFEAQFKAYSLSILCISNACQIPLKDLMHLLKVSKLDYSILLYLAIVWPEKHCI